MSRVVEGLPMEIRVPCAAEPSDGIEIRPANSIRAMEITVVNQGQSSTAYLAVQDIPAVIAALQQGGLALAGRLVFLEGLPARLDELERGLP